MAYQDPTEGLSATIAVGAAVSAAVELGGRAVVAVETPSAWTAAALSLQVSRDGATFVPLYQVTGPGAVTEWTIPSASIAAAEARAFAVDPSVTLGWHSLKVVSGVNGTTVNQAAERTVRLRVRGI